MELNRINMEHRIRSEKNEKKSPKKAEQSNYQQVNEADRQKSSRALAAYAAALMALGAMPATTSCVTQEQFTTVSFDQEELKNMLKEIFKMGKIQLENLENNNLLYMYENDNTAERKKLKNKLNKAIDDLKLKDDD